MDIERLYQDFSLDYKTLGEHKHVRKGFINIECPFCSGNPGYHLSYNITQNYYVCWRCGWHPVPLVISTILDVPLGQAYEVIKQYGDIPYVTKKKAPKKFNTKPFKLPSNIMALQPQHKKYLEKRGFDPDRLTYEWDLMGTLAHAKVEYLDYSYRIIIPYIWDDRLVTFDARDFTGKSKLKYYACELEREIIPHKNILYGRQDQWKSDRLIIVEGPTDVWRLGPENAGATSGIEFTREQVRYISKRFKRTPVLFDGRSATSKEKQSRKQADELVAELKFRGVDAFRVDIDGDPGDMEQSEADYLVKQLLE